MEGDMKCPHCEYVHGASWVNDEYKLVAGDFGNFFKLPVRLEKKEIYDVIQKQVFGCPRCNILFMEND
jgi:ribosomal protein L37AE/L43A